MYLFNNEYKEFDTHVEMYIERKDGTLVTCIMDNIGFEKVKKEDIRWKSIYDPKMNQYYIIGYRRGSGRNSKQVKLHRLLTNADEDKIVDHIDRDTLNNRLENLRVTSHQFNQQNRKIDRRNSTGFRNVRHRKDTNRYQAYITVNRKFISLGSYDSPEEASKVAEKARKKYYKGDVANVN